MADEEAMPAYVVDSVQAILRLRNERLSRTTRVQKLLNGVVSAVGRARFIVFLTIAVLLWVLGNMSALWLGHKSWDAPPFSVLQGVVSLVALYTTILILATQKHEDELALHREQLTLQLSLLSEQKSAKIIQLLEEMRRDSPHIVDRYDRQAADMAHPADPRSVLNAIAEDITPADPTPDNV